MESHRCSIATALLVALAGLTITFCCGEPPRANAAGSEDTASDAALLRSPGGLLVLYDFRDSEGATVPDRAGAGSPIDLRIQDLEAVRREPGSLEIVADALIESAGPATRLAEAIELTGEATIEVWVQPAMEEQQGPARIVTLSASGNERNFTLGQDDRRYDVRFRTTATSTNGIPSTSAKKNSVTTKLTHVVYTRDRAGRARVYVDGTLNDEQLLSGDTSNWDGKYRLGLANELTGDRPWRGKLFLVAVYNRSLRPHEIERHFRAGPDAATAPADVAEGADPAARRFNNEIAPLLAKHCVECHAPATRKGKLDLSREHRALAGGESGPAIVPGKADESLLWQYVETDTMPENRPPLSAEEKQLLRQWIDSGATWSLEVIDPAAYLHDRRAGQNWLRRLTVPEYIATVKATVGVDIAEDARRLLPPDLRADGFSNTAYNLNIDLQHVEAYAQLAELIVDRMDVKAFAAEFEKCQQQNDDCMRKLVASAGQWMLRGPLDEREIEAYLSLSRDVAASGGTYEEAVRLIVEAMLQSPRFVYRVENQRGDGTPWPVGPFELASRLSYIIWGASPDRELMRAAAAGELYDRRAVDAQVRRMLKDPRAIERSALFFYEWLNLGRLDNLNPSPDRFPDWNPQLAADMREETLAFFEEVIWKEQRPLSDLLSAQFTYATPRLAAHYGLQPRGEGWTRYDLSSVPARGGLLTQGSVLTVGGDEASMVTRGLFVLHDLLRGVVKDPPPCVDTTPVPSRPGLTQRAIAEGRIKNEACGGCHARFEPLAFGLERFDGLGTYHEKDEFGNPLREDGEVLFPGSEKPVAYQTSAQLMKLLSDSDRVRESLTWKVTQFALGRPLVGADAPIVARIHESAQRDGFTYSSLIKSIVMSELVQTTRTERAARSESQAN